MFLSIFIGHKTAGLQNVGGSGISADKNVQVEIGRKTGLSWAVVTRGKSRGKRITAKLSQHNCTINQMGTI